MPQHTWHAGRRSVRSPTITPTPSPRLPEPRGPLSELVLAHLRREPGDLPPLPAPTEDPLAGEDLHLTLYACYELHYRGLAGVDPRWEWQPSLLAARRDLEDVFEAALRERCVGASSENDGDLDVETALRQLLDDEDDGPSLSAYLEHEGTLEQFREFVVDRSAYQLKEADPHTFAIPRLAGAAKAALVTIQADEYGEGVLEKVHAELFARTMRELGLDDTYGSYVDHIPATTLATVNLVSMFGLHRRLRGALIGHLALFEMASVGPMASYSAALRRLGFGPWARLFYDTHVVADAEHQFLAVHELAGAFARDEPDLAPDVLFGARALAALEARVTRDTLAAWDEGRTCLLRPLPPSLMARAG